VFDPAMVWRLAGSMRSLAVLPEMFVYEIYCRDDKRRLAGPGYEFSWNLVMVRSGGFLQRLDGREDFYDATSAGFDVRHRALVAACRRGVDEFEVAERVYDLLGRFRSLARPAAGLQSPTERAHRALAAKAAEAMAAGHLTASIEDLARLVSCSAAHLSRVFHRVTGHSVTFHRNELRVRRVLTELAEGQRCLRSLSADHGFADQAHMTRVIGRHLGSTPSALRDLLGPAAGPVAAG